MGRSQVQVLSGTHEHEAVVQREVPCVAVVSASVVPEGDDI